MINRKFQMVLAGVIVCMMIVGANVVWNRITDYSTTLNANWGFSLPAAAHYSETYSLESEASIFGDGIRYHIFNCENPEPINEMFLWQTEESNTKSYASYSKACSEWLSEIGVPGDEYPYYVRCRYWYQLQEDGGDEIILFWDESIGTLYIIEFFL